MHFSKVPCILHVKKSPDRAKYKIWSSEKNRQLLKPGGASVARYEVVKCFHCNNCGMMVFFENEHCVKCGESLGFYPSNLEMKAIRTAGGNPCANKEKYQ